MPNPQLSVVVLSWNEEQNIARALAALACQRGCAIEVIVLDAASTDATVEAVRAAQAWFPFPLRLEVASRRIPIGQARNRGVALAAAPLVAYASADAELEETWCRRAVEALAYTDMVYGRQVHAPHRWTIGASVRGLRYSFPEVATADACPFASNVAAAYRVEVLQAFPFDTETNAAEDLVLARRAKAAGWRAFYDPRLVAVHHDVADWRGEWRKVCREGRGWAQYRRDLGLLASLMAWGLALMGAVAWIVVAPAPGAAALIILLWAPAVWRVFRRGAAMPVLQRLKGAAASPLFDVALLATYGAALLRRPMTTLAATAPSPQGDMTE
ncbi:MAG: glycosyltransferase family 2 protein [Thermoplasmatota archaeon]